MIHSSNGLEVWVFNITLNIDGTNKVINLTTGKHGLISDTYTDPIECITNKPSITSTLNIEKGTSTTGGVSINCINVKIDSLRLSEYLLKHESSNSYTSTNASVSVAKYNNLVTTPVVIFNGFIENVSYTTNDEVTINCQVRRWWDDIIVGGDVENDVDAPIVYGLYTPNASTINSPDLCNDNDLHPISFNKIAGDKALFLTQQAETSDARPHCWEESLKKFVPIGKNDTSYTDATFVDNGSNYTSCRSTLKRAVKWDTTDTNSAITNVDGEWEDLSNLTDGDDNTFAKNQGSVSVWNASNTNTWREDKCGISPPQLSGVPTSIKLELKLAGSSQLITYNPYTYWNAHSEMHIKFFGDWYEIQDLNINPVHNGSNTDQSATFTTNTSGGNTSTPFVVTLDLLTLASGGSFSIPDPKTLPETIELRVRWRLYGLTGGMSGFWFPTYKVYYAKWIVAYETPASETGVVKSTQIENLKFFSGSDGLVQSWNTGSACNGVVQIHRDLLYRHCGLTATPTQYSSSGTGGAVATARANWSGRVVIDKPTPLKKVLEKLQFEGCFLFVVTRTDPNGKYLFVYDGSNNTYSSSDVDVTLTDKDISDSGVRFSTTPTGSILSNITTRWKKNYGSGTFEHSYTHNVSATRTEYGLGSLLKKEKVDLDYLWKNTASDPSNLWNNWTDYYLNIRGKSKIIAEFEIVNPTIMIDIGDIVKLNIANHSNIFGATASRVYFMVIKSTISLNTNKVTLREVGNNNG